MSKRKSLDLLPVIFRTDANNRFLSGTIDQLIQQPKLKKIDGFIGERAVTNFNPETDSYINSNLEKSFRTDYEVEPGIVTRNAITDNVEFAKSYEDILNSLKFYGSDVSNQDRLFKQQSYTWNPHIDLDKFINYRNYVWIPEGPPTILVIGDEKVTNTTVKVGIVSDENSEYWNFSSDSVAVNPTITLYRGMTYVFDVDTVDNPFYIKTKRTSGSLDLVENVLNNGSNNGNVVFEVTDDIPATLFYVSGKDSTTFGKFLIRNKTENTALNVEEDILGKKNYEVVGKFKLSNGMKIRFSNVVMPESYREKTYIVEGVGESITLVDYESLVTIEGYSSEVESSFDETSFDDLPFDQVSNYPLTPDYILINRSSKDKNPWSRYNRWFHIDVVTLSSEINGVEPNYGTRASRPIIEFQPNIRLYNFSSQSKRYVDFLDTRVTDAYSSVEGSVGFFVDGVQLQNGNRVIFTAEKDASIRNKIFEVKFLDIDGNKKLHLEQVIDSDPLENQGLLVLSGNENGGTTWLYKNDEWVPAQRKTTLNQSPLFDLFDNTGKSFSDSSYTNNNFSGTKLFGYQIGTGVNDSVLGFPLKYANVSNVGGYLFENFIETGSSSYFDADGNLITVDFKDGFIKVDDSRYENFWTLTNAPSIQEIIDQQVAMGGEEYLEFNSINVNTPKTAIRVFKNGTLLPQTDYTVSADVTFDSYFINFNVPLIKNDVITIRSLPVFDKGIEGKYETPINLINNPLNEVPFTVSYAEINDHVNSILLNASKAIGASVNKDNLRDLPNLYSYGRRFVQHQGLVSMAGAMLCDKQINFISSIRWAALEYQRYKTSILQKFVDLPSYNSIPSALDDIITDISKDKNNKSTFYYSDMVPYGLNKRDYEYTVRDVNIISYAYGSKIYNSKELNNNAILVYLNNELLIKDKDYHFDTIEPLVTFDKTLNLNDKVLIKFYNNIYGSCMPFSPTKLGLYPAFIPEIYKDETYLEPTDVIQGHDGSITVCFGDDRDLLLLELETRIYNNLNSFYDNRIFDVIDVVPGIFRSNKEELVRVNKTIEEEFLRWTGLYNIDYETNENEIYGGNFSYNFVNSVGELNPESVLNGSWRKIYRYYFDTDRPHSHPWEMLGFSIKPDWWDTTYGPAPYSAGNDVLWKDLEDGYIRDGNRKGYDSRYKRIGLSNILPVDSYGNLKDPFDVNVVKYFDFSQRYQQWKFGDMGPAESSWRRSHLYPFAIQIAMALNLPAKYLTLCFDTSRNTFNNANQTIYKDTNQRISPKDLKIYSDFNKGFIFATGYSPYIVEYLRLKNTSPATTLKNYINNIKSNLMYKLGGFASKDKFNVALETVTSYKTVDKVFVPQENYQLFLSTGNPIKTLSMSGIIVERGTTGFVIKGYDNVNPYFKINKAITAPNDPVITVGGTTESFIYWAPNANITGGSIISVGQKYYRAVSTHLTKESFDPALYYPLPYLPTIGGIDATVPSNFEDTITLIPYGTILKSSQEVFNFILGYGSYLESEGFIFDKILSELEVVADWKLAGKEFLFWSVQNWANNSVISLAPFADTVKFYSEKSVVEDINDLFYDYSLLKSDGSAIDKNRINIVREDNTFLIDTSKISNDGIYFVKINLVQKEHIVVFDNFTIFNDLIYQPYSGYRQNRFKVSGYITDNWTGDFYIPGFVYDSAKIEDWQVNVDYNIGDVVKFQTRYYQANTKLLPAETFNYENWSELGKAPVAQLLPNFEYKITQFEDFYSLESENFDDSQKKYAQKLIGYVPRNYLNSLIVDETSQYKFYQGFIKEKGTVAPLEKFSVASNQALGSHLSVQEEWAIRLGTFGGENTYKEIEFSLDQNKFNQDPQLFEFVYGENVITSPRSYPVDQSSLLIKPIDFNGAPWPTLDVNKENGTSYLQYQKLPTAGYPRIDDVTFTALYENNILSLGASGSLQEGDTVWVAMDKKGDWSVKRYTKSSSKIINYQVDNANNLIQFITDVAHNLKLRDFISIARMPDPLNGVYEVIGIDTPNTFVVSTTFNDIPDSESILDGSLYYFLKTRFTNLDELANIPGIARWKNCEFVWIDDDGTGNWSVLEKENSSIPTPLRPFKEDSKQYFGQSVAIAPVTNIFAVSATNVEGGRIYVYRREVLGSTDVQLDQSYLVEENVSDVLSIQTLKDGVVVEAMPRNHGASIGIWENESLSLRYIVTGAPNASGVKWISSGVTFENEPIKKPVDFSYQSSGIFDEGLIKIVKYDNLGAEFVTDIILASPSAERSSNFGHKVKIVGNTNPFIMVSAPGQDSKTGSTFIYYLDSNKDWQVVLLNNQPFDFRSRITQISQGSEFGWDIASSSDGNIVAISAPSYLKDRTQAHIGAVFVFQKDAVNYTYTLKQSIYADDFIEPGDLLLKGVSKSYSTVEITLVFDATEYTLTRNRGNFIQDGFRTGQTVQVTGSRFNNFEFVIDGISTTTLTFKANELMANENVTTPITIIGLGTARKDRFGDKISMTSDGSLLLISSDHSSQNKLDAGMVYALNKNTSGQYVLNQKISSPSAEPGELFGNNIEVSPDGKILLVTAAGGDQASNMYFDSYIERIINAQELYGSEYVLNPKSALRPLRTTFDSGSTRFVDKAQDSGLVYLYQKLGNYFVFGESLVSGDASDADGYGTGLATNGKYCLVGAPRYEYRVEGQDEINPNITSVVTYSDAGTVVFFDNSPKDDGSTDTWSWSKARYQDKGLVDIDKIKKVISYNTDTLNILENYEIYDPVKGKIPTKVIQEIKYITPYDPAVYTVAVNVGNKNRVDNKTTWTAEHVGELWLDTSTLRYVWYEQGSAEFRINNWGKLFPGATVDVYEWVKSDYRPSEWATLADTEDGLAQGISGQPKNPDNTVVSINQYFDPIINDFVNVYYFWVRNKITIPDLNFRSISSFECSRIIEDPKTQGIKYASFLSPSSIALANTKKDLDAKKINIDIYYRDSDVEINRHSHWQLINENNKYAVLDPMIELKLFDSLVGQDELGNSVPDPRLSPKMRYGILNNPRQSWFVNREKALKTLLVFVNNILLKNDVVGKVNLDNLDDYDAVPLESYGYYDEIVESKADLSSIGTAGKIAGELEAEIINGRLVNVNIVDSGVGYKIAPTVEIIGDGTGARIQTAIDLSGKIVSVKILSQGINYTSAPKLLVRPYSVLVTLDEEINKWAIYQSINNIFERKISQIYDVRNYWSFVDWVSDDYSVEIPPKFVIEFTSDLATSNFSIDDTVKIRNTGDGRSIVLRKVELGKGNYLSDYDLIYRERGTIQFSEKLYNKAVSGLGFDSFVGFDQNSFDESNATEIRKILVSVKNDIFVGDLAQYWNKFIFVAIKYVLSEQLFVDWVYKTSFITPIIDAGLLDQKEIYRFNDFAYVEEFVNEIKPYRSKFREITTNHQVKETINVGVTDFDLPSYIDINGNITIPSTSVIENVYPFKYWNDNKGFSVKQINIANPGNGYRLPPQVVINPAQGDSGRGATAIARISNGKLSEIVVTNPGTGYLLTPNVVIVGGGNYDTDFVQAKASAELFNDYIRTSEIKLRFDRTSDKGLFTGQFYSRNFTTDGITLNYVLTYPVDDFDDNYPAMQDKETIKVLINEVEVGEDAYRVTFRTDLSTIITFNVALPANQNLRIQYIKNFLYTKDIFEQTTESYKDTFQLTFPPELDNQKIVITSINGITNVGYTVPYSDYLIQLVQSEVSHNKFIGYIKFKNVPTVGSIITVQYAKNINIQNAVDRIITSYQPTVGMPGKDITQLMKGVEFGGVQVQGLNFSVSSGWDGLPWFTQGWDTFVNDYKDLLVISDGTTATYDLGYVPLLGTQINVYFAGVRVDDEYFGTGNQTNSDALFKTIVANGASNTITLPVLPSKTYSNVATTNLYGTGSNAEFDVIRTGAPYQVAIKNTGSGYKSVSKTSIVYQFELDTLVSTGSYVRTLNGSIYKVITGGTTSSTVIPNFTEGTASNGTTIFEYSHSLADKKLKISNTTGIIANMRIVHPAFTNKQRVISIFDNETIIISSNPDYDEIDFGDLIIFGDELKILGNLLEGYSPSNDLTILVTGVDNTGKIQTFDTIGNSFGIKIEIRQSLSDGVTLPTDDFVLDTSLSGGDFTTIRDALETRFRTATGLRPDDISVDGGQFLSIEHSPSTEELVKGEIFDTLSMTVFNSPSSGSNLVRTYQYLYDGTNPTYEITGSVDSNQSIDVYVNNFLLDRSTDFTVSSLGNGNSLVTLTTTDYGISTANLVDKISVTIQNMSIGGSNILNRVNYIVTSSDSTANLIEIDLNVSIDDIGSYYLSIPNSSTLEKKSNRSKRAKVVINNSPSVSAGDLITVILFSSSVKTYSEVFNQEISITANSTYLLTRPPGDIEPLHVMAAVTRLTPSSIDWKGSWEDGIEYNVNDTVLFSNRSYVCILGHKSYYSLNGVTFSSWALATNYVLGDVVNFGNNRYICISAHLSNNTSNTPTNNLLWSLHTGNRPDEDYSGLYWEALPRQRLLPPETEYYEVTQDSQTFELGKNFPYISRSLSVSDIEVYRNGKIMATNRDYEFDNVTNSVQLSSGVAFAGDVIAISVLRGAEYLIRNGQIIFTNFANLEIGQKIVVTTYTNHDGNLMRREVFKGQRLLNEYKVSRRILSINNVWVDLNGRPLIPNVDYDIKDNYYVKLSDKFDILDSDRIVVTSISDVTSVDPIAYRLFKDMTNTVQFKRISKKSTTSLTSPLLITDREIHVQDASIFGVLETNSTRSGVIFIGGERIEFKSVNGNVLSSLTRGTSGTGSADVYPAGSKVFNVSQSETVPYKEGSVIQTVATPSNYRYNEQLDQYERYSNGFWVSLADGELGAYTLIDDFNFTDQIPYEDQITVYMAGRVLLKPAKSNNPLIKHDFSITLDSNETNSQGQTGDIEIDPDFTVSKVNGNYILQININSLMRDEANNIIPDLQIRVVQKTGKIWYTLDGDQTLQQDNTVQAKFLQEFPAELPDRNYYATNVD